MQLSRTASGYVPALDGLRAVSILLVVVSHLDVVTFVPGAFGVTLFFFISGYLITSQLAAEYGRTGAISFRGFYLRRLLRLTPAAMAFILGAGLAFDAMGGTIRPGGWLAAIFYGANYYDLFVHYDNAGLGYVRNPFNIIWSLAVEEQFYMVWPLLMTVTLGLWSRRWGGAIALMVAICVIEPIWRLHLFHYCFPDGRVINGVCSQDRLAKATDTRLDSLAWGALAALIIGRSWFVALVRNRWVQVIALVLLAASFGPGAELRQVYRYTLDGITLAILIPAVTEGHMRGLPGIALLETGAAIFIGRISYSLYLWHWGGDQFADYLTHGAHDGVWVAFALLLGFGIACASYYGIERPMIAVRRRFGSHAPHTIVPARQREMLAGG